MTQYDLELKQITKIYPGGTLAVEAFDLQVEKGEFLSFVGPSGCGKTTTLRMIAGLEEITDGEILIGDKVVNVEPPKDRDIAMVFQNYALYPHMTVFENMSFGLRLRKLDHPVGCQAVHVLIRQRALRGEDHGKIAFRPSLFGRHGHALNVVFTHLILNHSSLAFFEINTTSQYFLPGGPSQCFADGTNHNAFSLIN